MRSVVRKSGDSASVRIPAAVMRAANMALNEAVEVREEAGRIVIEPMRLMEYHLDDLLEQITPENLHAEVEFGRPKGKEVW